MSLNGKKVLIFNCAGMGDAIMFTPSLRRIKELFPTCSISFATKRLNKDVLVGLPYIDNIFMLDRGYALDKMRLAFQIILHDYIIFTDRQSQLSKFAHLVNRHNVCGIPRRHHMSEKVFNRNIQKWVLDSPEYAAKTIRDGLSKALEIEIDADFTKLDVSVPQPTPSIKYLLSGINQYICIAPFTGLKERDWPITHVNKLICLIKDNFHIPVFVIGRPHNQTPNMDEINLVGKTSFYEMVEIIRKASLFITCSTNLHVLRF